ncbi:MAG TPA: methyltransferase domain-containing protein, partial [Pyrinomonadaceae bacterium]
MTQLRDLPGPEDLKHYLKSFDFFERHVHGQWEGDLYAETHSRRFYETLRFLPKLPVNARVLELGALPYYFTILLERFAGIRPDTLSFFEFEESESAKHTVRSADTGERYEFDYRAVNIETEIFPFAENTYDLVLCCEILEHLLINPSHMLYEAHRVLRSGGHILITTPNVLRWNNLWSMIRGANIYDRYHGNGIYGRHNREYSPSEISELLQTNGYQIERLETRNVYSSSRGFFANRRDNIFVLARATGEARVGFPESLYVLMDEYRNVARPAFTMGVDDAGQIGRGWYDVEVADKSFRWSGKTAKFYLKNQGGTKVVLRGRSAHPQLPVTLTLRVNEQCAGVASLADHSWQDLVFNLGALAGAAILSCELEVSNTWEPPGDGRQLGIAIHRIFLSTDSTG